MHNATSPFRNAASQFSDDDFAIAVIGALPAYAVHTLDAEHDAMEIAYNAASTAAAIDGASFDDIREAGQAAAEAVEKASLLASHIWDSGRACRATVAALPHGADIEAAIQRATDEAARAITLMATQVVVVVSRPGAVRPN